MILVLLLNIYVINIYFSGSFLKKIADLKSTFKFEVNFWSFLEVVTFSTFSSYVYLKFSSFSNCHLYNFTPSILPLPPSLLPSFLLSFSSLLLSFPLSLSPPLFFLLICFSLIFLHLRNCSFWDLVKIFWRTF